MLEPIAVVGRGCVLPDALDPAAFGRNLLAGKLSLSPAPAGRWRLPRADALGAEADPDRTWTDVGGYVRGFRAAFDPTGFELPAGELTGLDRLSHWLLHAGRQALAEAGRPAPGGRAGLVVGNLSFPSASMSRYAEEVWLGDRLPGDHVRTDPRNRFSSGLPAVIAARALGLGQGGYALDAACSSALYAIKLACDRLRAGTADLMLAGGVNCADDLFIHIGFCALSAMSRSGQSRPFHRDADGLVPAEGAALVALMRLSDALAAGHPVLGVIRGIGLSNDGRAGGLLVPAQEGQERAMLLAYAAAGVDPAEVSLVECHATGTAVGDMAEVGSMARVFGAAVDLPIGSVKSNIGHLITAAGGAGLLKVLAAMEAGVRPPTLGADEELPELTGTPMRLVREPEEWAGRRLAAVSAFGFGGNNAHLVIEAWPTAGYLSTAGGLPTARPVASPAASTLAAAGDGPPGSPAVADAAEVGEASGAEADQVAIVAVGARVGDGDDLVRRLLDGSAGDRRLSTVDVELTGLRFPPRDLEQTLAQQLLVLVAARDAIGDRALPRDRTMVLVGMGCDPEVNRYGARWRAGTWLDGPDLDRLSRWRDAFGPALTSAGVLGTMPNLVANRLNAQFDLAGPSFTVSAEEASGMVALQLAAHALRSGEADAAVVGAVDASAEPVHEAALRDLGIDRPSGDAAVVLVLRRLADARLAGEQVIAVLDGTAGTPAGLVVGPPVADGDGSTDRFDPVEVFGSAHAASGLLAVAVAALAVAHRAVPRPGRPAVPALGLLAAEATVTPLGGAGPVTVRLDRDSPMAWVSEPPPRLHRYSGVDRDAVLDAMDAGAESDTGPARLAVMAADRGQLAERSAAARRWLTSGGRQPDGVAFREAPLGGQVAFVFSGGSMAYPGMGREALLAFPDLLDRIERRCGSLREVVGWVYRAGPDEPRHVLEQIWGASMLGQLHTRISRDVLGIRPDAAIGYSSGETNALVALGAWNDPADLVRDAQASTLFSRDLVGGLDAVLPAWRAAGVSGDRWASYLVGAPADAVRDALVGEPAVHLMMVNAADSCVVGGEAAGAARVVERIGGVAIPIPYQIAVHVPELASVRDAWWTLHHRPTSPVPGVRFYTGASGTSYQPTAEAAADALTAQALATIDFAAVVGNAWEDGVRVFLEHGPRGLCTGWIQRTLAGREHLAVALDGPEGRGIYQLVQAVAELAAAGLPVRDDQLTEHLATGWRPVRAPAGSTLLLPAHPPAVRLPDPAEDRMAPAPPLPPTIPVEPQEHAMTEPGIAGPDAVATHPAGAGAVVAVPVAVQPGWTVAAPVGPPSPPVAGSDALVRELLAGLAAVHQDYLASQADVHGEFLASRQRLTALPAGRPSATAPAATALPAAKTPAAALPPATLPPAALPPAALPAATTTPARLPGPKFDRADLEWLAGREISALFGPRFAAQDGYPRQTRMPLPPMLLADRVTGIDAVPCSMGTGTIWTETDVPADAWYLDAAGRMPAGIMIEAGQADLLLISWLGVDLLTKGERIYRLLGCELTYHGSPPAPGETLRYEIRIDGHGEHDGIRLFFFGYDCYVGDELRLTVRNGQAGFFTDTDLAASAGVLWDPAAEIPPAQPVDPPHRLPEPRSFGPDAVVAFADGQPADCFGAGWERARSHVRSPRTGEDAMRLLHEVTVLDPTGGPWGRGYLRAQTPVSADDWFFEGHFKNDPCMPGTLIFEGCLQAMAFYLAGLGFTIERDGWRFEPVPGASVPMRCRGQVTPHSKMLRYEVFVRGLSAGPEPTLLADVLCTVDGLAAFHAAGVGLRLVPDWPLTRWRQLGPPAEQTTGEPIPSPRLAGLVGHRETGAVAEVDGFAFGYDSLLACAWGRPSEAFGPMYERFDGARRVARLPGPPYHFMSRIVSVDGPIGGMAVGSRVVAEYDVPDKVWYFEQNGHPAMPLAVLMEVALQPCGWLASYVGSALTTDTDLLFRNLDGTCTVIAEIHPGTRTVRTEVELTQVSQNGDMIIESFAVRCLADGVPALELTTVFGYFPKEAFDDQVGLVPSEPELAALAAPCGFAADLRSRPEPGSGPRLAGPMLRMIDRVTGYWPDGGQAGLGRLRAEKDVDPGEWFFAAHFFGDPVQPGSLGIEALAQLLQFGMIERGMAAGLVEPRFEPVLTGAPLVWKYRGQVVPTNRLITTEIEILEIGEDEGGRYALARGWLWVDGKRIYHAGKLGMRIVGERAESTVDVAADGWLADHRPTWTVPALPMMSVVDRLAGAAAAGTQRHVVAVRDVSLRRWLTVDGPIRLRADVAGSGDRRVVTLLAWRDAANPALSRFEPVATGMVVLAADWPEPPPAWSPLPDAEPQPDPYQEGRLFHGPAFRYLSAVAIGPTGSSGTLDAGRGAVPHGLLHQGLLDAATHAVPHDRLARWSAEIGPDVVGYPHRIEALELYGPLPREGEVQVEARFAGFDGGDRRHPVVDIQLSRDGRVLAGLRLVEVLLPTGRLGAADPAARRDFLQGRHVAGLGLSTRVDGTTRLSAADVERCDWLPGTVATVYGLPAGARATDRLAGIAVRDHVAALLGVHPSALQVGEVVGGRATAGLPGRPDSMRRVRVEATGEDVTGEDVTVWTDGED
jgi:PfaB family protein